MGLASVRLNIFKFDHVLSLIKLEFSKLSDLTYLNSVIC